VEVSDLTYTLFGPVSLTFLDVVIVVGIVLVLDWLLHPKDRITVKVEP
jgi:hypothetical protein